MNETVLEAVGCIEFDGSVVNVYNDLNHPLFIIRDVARLLGYRLDHAARLTDLCEEDEYLRASIWRSGQKRYVTAVTELGLYNILSQMRTETARKWRVIVFNQLVDLRLQAKRNITEQFEVWDERADNIWFDEETGKMMYWLNGPGGDPIIKAFGEDDEK